MEKKISQQLAALYARHNSLMNLIRALEEYTQQPQVPAGLPFYPTQRPRRPRRRRIAA